MGLRFAAIEGRTVLITGATSGLGRELARALAPLGPRLYLAGRDRARAEQVRDELSDRADVHLLLGDLSTRAGVRAVAEAFLATGDPLHVLVNNAGGVGGFRREVTEDGVEATFALNHLAPFQLTMLLLPRLLASAPARIVNVASDAYKDAKGRFDFDVVDGDAGGPASPIRRYGMAKLGVVLFTRELARRLEGTGVTANAATPPRTTGTRFAHGVHPLARVAMTAARPFLLSPRKGVAPIVHLCASPEAEGLNGTYWSGMRQPALTEAATHDGDAARLWERSVELTGVTPPV